MIYKLNDKYLKNYEPSKLLERAKARRFIIISNPDKYGSVRVWELGMSRKTTYHVSFLEEDAEGQARLETAIVHVLKNEEFVVDATQKDGFTQAYRKQAQLILAEVNYWLESLCIPDPR